MRIYETETKEVCLMYYFRIFKYETIHATNTLNAI